MGMNKNEARVITSVSNSLFVEVIQAQGYLNRRGRRCTYPHCKSATQPRRSKLDGVDRAEEPGAARGVPRALHAVPY